MLGEGLTLEQMRGMLRLHHAQLSQDLADTLSQLRNVELRLHQMEREEQLATYDVLLGVPLANAVTTNGGVSAEVLPAGRYASLVYTGPYAGDGLMYANAALLEWGVEQGLEWDRFDDPTRMQAFRVGRLQVLGWHARGGGSGPGSAIARAGDGCAIDG